MPQSYTLLPTCLGSTNNLTAYAELIINSFGKEKAQKKADFSLKRYSWAICINDEAYASKEIQHNRASPIPQTMKALPRFIFMTYPWYWIKRMYRSKYFRQFMVICMACLLAVSVFLTIFLAYDNAQLRIL